MNFRDLLNSLLPKAAKWNSIGIQLGLSTDELDTIRANCIVEECLSKSGMTRPSAQHDHSPQIPKSRIAKDLEHKMVIVVVKTG